MQSFANKLLTQLEEELRFTEQENDAVLKRSELCFEICRKSINELKAFILKYKFKSQSEEIKFFKEIKPKFTAKLIYHLTVYNIETKKPNGGKEVLKNYYAKELEKLKNYFDYNLDFYKYYRSDANYLDHKYFIRGKHDIHLALDGYVFENDMNFTTSHDFKVAKIFAHDKLQVTLEDELAFLERKVSANGTQEYFKSKLTWTDNKISAIELIYALHSIKCINSGNAEIAEIATAFENIFNIELNDYYRKYIEIKSRKGQHTKFLEQLKAALNNRINTEME